MLFVRRVTPGLGHGRGPGREGSPVVEFIPRTVVLLAARLPSPPELAGQREDEKFGKVNVYRRRCSDV